MADITKKVNRLIPANQRFQIFDNTDAGDGDVILVKESLGKSAKSVSIEATDAMFIRPNVYHTVYPLRDGIDDLDVWGGGQPNLTSGIQIQDDTSEAFAIDAGSSLDFDNDIPINDIELVSVSGVFTITVM